MYKSLYLFSCLLALQLLLSAGQCTQKPKEDIIKEIAGKQWKHAHENDQESLTAYRPSTYSFPPSRGRASFALQEDGTFTDYPISPRDGNDKVAGTWETAGDKSILVKLSNGNSYRLLFSHISEEGILFLKKEYL